MFIQMNIENCKRIIYLFFKTKTSFDWRFRYLINNIFKN